MYRLLIVEDDRGIAEGVREQAEAWDITARIVTDFHNVMAEFSRFDPHIVLLDISLPFFNGYHWCGEIRRVSNVPVIFISSAADNMNMIMAMNMGADDFIAKPFDGSVLIAKIQALLRRTYDFAPSVPVLEHKGAMLNTGDGSFLYKNEKIPLSKNEYRILQKNKRYYYRKNHFVSVSSMVYRMKRNGAGLASICVLSTMVLVMILGAGSLYFGAEDSLRARYPKSITVTTDYNPYDEKTVYSAEKADMIVCEVDNVVNDFGAALKNTERYTSATVACLLSGGTLTANPELVNAADASTIKNVCNVIFISLDEYNRCMNKSETLKDGEIFIHCVRREYNGKTLTIGKLKYTVKKQLEDMINNGRAASEMVPSVFVVMNNPEKAYDEVNSQFTSDRYFCCPRLYYSFDTGLSAERDIELADKISERLRNMDINGTGGYYSRSVECREAERADFYGTYGGLFYLGIILSTVFLLATVLIIYYKQITEGYEDESRFEIMQKVGMTKRDIQKSINSQMLTVFLLPLITAALHLCFAFPMIRRLLTLFNLNNVPLMLIVLAGAVLVFGVLYALIYKFTSNSYFAIVSGKNESK